MIAFFFFFCATLSIIGHLPAPGTTATIIIIALLFLLQPLFTCSDTFYLFIGLFCFISYFVIYYVLQQNIFKNNDPSEIVLDEVVGTLITFAGITLNIKTMIIGFLLFRFFDIVKPLGIKKLEKLNSALGIIGDDIAAGLISALLLRIIIFYVLS